MSSTQFERVKRGERQSMLLTMKAVAPAMTQPFSCASHRPSKKLLWSVAMVFSAGQVELKYDEVIARLRDLGLSGSSCTLDRSRRGSSSLFSVAGLNDVPGDVERAVRAGIDFEARNCVCTDRATPRDRLSLNSQEIEGRKGFSRR